MFWLFLLFLFGASYVYYRYIAIANKKIFFTSPFFLSIAGSLGILLSVIGIVNIANIRPADFSENVVDTLEVERIDSSANNLRSRGSAFSYRVIKKLNHEYKHDYLKALRKTYAGFAESDDDNVSSLGNFGLGLMALEDKKLELAREHFGEVRNQALPFFHFCKGELMTRENKKEEAAREYEQELEIADGNRIPAYELLVTLYEENQNYKDLHALLDSDLADDYFPERLARNVSLRMNDMSNYSLWTLKIFSHRMNAIGFIAAFLISAMWLVYLSYLDIFKPEKFVWLIVMFVGGMVFVPAVFLFTDSIGIISSWHLNSHFLNDFGYAIFMIGVPEEFAKILPLLIFTLFSKNIKEPVDYLIYGCASALGFAFLENLIYFAEIKNGIIHGRAYLAVIGHMTDTTIVAYAFVFSKYRLKNPKTLWYTLPTTFFTAAVVHGLYDVLLFHNLMFFFFIFFILIVQFWIIMINNAMNNSLHFSYRRASRAEGSGLFITLALTTIFALEYLHAGISSGAVQGNSELLSNAGFAGFFIIFFSSNLASFDLIKGYWRSVSIFSKEKRGYGNRGQISPLFSWYFVNASRSHNYVGLVVKICSDAHNRILREYLDGEYQGKIVGRIILYEDRSPDPHWFLIRMAQPLPLPYDRQDYVLARLRYQEDSLLYEDYVEIFFKGVPDLRLLKDYKPQKSDFPFYGWAILACDENQAVRSVEAQGLKKLA